MSLVTTKPKGSSLGQGKITCFGRRLLLFEHCMLGDASRKVSRVHRNVPSRPHTSSPVSRHPKRWLPRWSSCIAHARQQDLPISPPALHPGIPTWPNRRAARGPPTNQPQTTTKSAGSPGFSHKFRGKWAAPHADTLFPGGDACRLLQTRRLDRRACTANFLLIKIALLQDLGQPDVSYFFKRRQRLTGFGTS